MADEAAWTAACEKYFTVIDMDKSGFVDPAEVNKYLSMVCPAEMIDANAKAMMEQGDTNKDGKLSKEEFVAFMKSTKPPGGSIAQEIASIEEFIVKFNSKMADEADEAAWTAALEKYFTVMDMDKSGFVDLAEVSKCLLLIGKIPAEMVDANAKAMMEQGDSNKDGKLSKEEFVALVNRTKPPGGSIADQIEKIETNIKKVGVEMKVSNKKGAGVYIRAATSFLNGLPAQEAIDGKEAVEAKDPVENLRISGLGDAINVAVATAAAVCKQNLGTITKITTSYPDMPSGRGCAQITISIANSNK